MRHSIAFVSALAACGAPAKVEAPRAEVPAPAPTPAPAPEADTDGDKVIGVDDQCPDEIETYNGNADEDGCPDMSATTLTFRDLTNERTVRGPTRPAVCPVFRRILSPAGQLETWFYEFSVGEVEHHIGTFYVDRVIAVVTTINSQFVIVSEPGAGETPSLALQRAQWVRDLLAAAGAPSQRLTIAPAASQRTGVGRVGFRVVDRTVVTTSYFCYDRVPPRPSFAPT